MARDTYPRMSDTDNVLLQKIAYQLASGSGSSSALSASTFFDATSDGWAIDFFEDYTAGAISSLTGGTGWGGNGVVSGGTIQSVGITNSRTEKRLELTSGYLGRKMAWGSDWHRLQIALLVSFSGTSNFTSDLAIGVCNGTTNMYNSTTCANWVGMLNDPAGPATWTYNAGTNYGRYTQAVGTRFDSRRVNTTTDHGSGSGSQGNAFAASSQSKSLIFIEISRPVAATTATSVTYSFACRSTNTTQIEFPATRRQLIEMFSDGSASIGGELGDGLLCGRNRCDCLVCV